MDPNWIGAIGGILVSLLGAVGWVFRKMLQDVSVIKTDVEVMKVYITQALSLKDRVEHTGSQVIRLEERQDKLTKDVNALHEAKRDLYGRLGR